MLNKIIIILAHVVLFQGIGQNFNLPVTLNGTNDMNLHTPCQIDTAHIEVTKWQCYLGHFSFIYANGDTLTKNTYQLLTIPDSSSTTALTFFEIPDTNLIGIHFQLGVDSAQLYKGVFEGDLDPAKGMFWAWNTGYINFKLEFEDTLLNEYQYHIGGYASPTNTVQYIQLNAPKGKVISGINFNLKQLIQFIVQNTIAPIMSPGQPALNLSTIVKACFSIQTVPLDE